MGEAPEKRDWGESLSLIFAFVVFVALPGRYTIAGPLVTLVLAVAMAATCVLSIVSTVFGSRRTMFAIMKVTAGIMALGLLTSMAKVVYLVVYQSSHIEGTRLLETALQIWIFNVIIFAVIYHWIGEGEFLFPRRDGAPAGPMIFLDYLFLSFTTSTAFSPTDTAPLTTRARMFMMMESTISLTTIAIAAARAVNILT